MFAIILLAVLAMAGAITAAAALDVRPPRHDSASRCCPAIG